MTRIASGHYGTALDGNPCAVRISGTKSTSIEKVETGLSATRRTGLGVASG
jgi:hypothetical protein